MAITRRGRFILDHRNKLAIPYPSVEEAQRAIPGFLEDGHVLRPYPVARDNPPVPECLQQLEAELSTPDYEDEPEFDCWEERSNEPTL